MKEGKMYAGCNRCPVYNDFIINLCYNCGKYGHRTQKNAHLNPAAYIVQENTCLEHVIIRRIYSVSIVR